MEYSVNRLFTYIIQCVKFLKTCKLCFDLANLNYPMWVNYSVYCIVVYFINESKAF